MLTRKGLLSPILCVILLIFTLSSCTRIVHSLQSAANVGTSNYPAAEPCSPKLDRPPAIDLRAYKSVQTRANQRSDIAIAIAASGGGYRAANLTLGVLAGLEEIKNPALKGNLLQEVDYYSTASGSGLGVGYYLTKLHNYLQEGNARPFSLNQHIEHMLATQGLVANPLRMDLTDYLFFGEERGLKLEGALNDGVLHTPSNGLVLGDIFVPRGSKERVQLPYWAINTTVYQNVTIFPFTPDVLKYYRVFGYFHNYRRHTLDGYFSDSRYAYDMPVSVGLTASATVPFVIPATTLMSNACTPPCYLQLFDGGLADNLGVFTAMKLLLQDKSKIKMLIIIDAYKGSDHIFSKQMEPPEGLVLASRIANAVTDVNREHVKSNIFGVSKAVLCDSNVSNVITIYLDLKDFPEARQINTQLSLTQSQQKLLINIGRKLVRNNKQFKTFVEQLRQNHLRLGLCGRGD